MAAIAQTLAVSYPAVVNERNKAANQFSESSLLDEMETQGAIKRINFGPTLEATLSYRRNPGTAFLSTDLQPVVMSKTEVINAASYTPGQISVPMIWSKMDEATNPTENQKIKFVSGLIDNGLESHDDALEQGLLATSTNGFLGLLTHITTTGLTASGGIDPTTDTWWRNQQATYVDETDIVTAWTTVWNACTKGSNSKLQPTIIVSNSDVQALFEGTQQPLQRWAMGQALNAGFTKLKFKNAVSVFSPYGTTSAFFFNPRVFMMVVSRQFFRDREDPIPLEDGNGWVSKIYSAVQTLSNNRSRLGVAHI